MYSDLLIGDLSDKRFYGIYRGVVAENADPEKRGRLRVQVPQILGAAVTSWAWPVVPAELSITDGATKTGNVTDAAITIDLVPVGSGVWVMFEGGDPNFPLWIGRF